MIEGRQLLEGKDVMGKWGDIITNKQYQTVLSALRTNTLLEVHFQALESGDLILKVQSTSEK